MHKESREKPGPQVRLGAVRCSVLPEGWGQRQSELPPQFTVARGRLARPPPVLWTCEREEEGKGGRDEQERRKQP